MVNNFTNINKISHLNPLQTKKGGGAMAYDVGNPDPGMGQAQKCGGVKLVNGIPILFS
jgi:hypothetical protein